MSSGGFTGKGMFASMAYLVVEYDGGKQKQCNFKDERDGAVRQKIIFQLYRRGK